MLRIAALMGLALVGTLVGGAMTLNAEVANETTTVYATNDLQN